MVDRVSSKKIRDLKERIGVGNSVASELLTLSGGNIELAETASLESGGLDQCKAAIIDKRFKAIESRLER